MGQSLRRRHDRPDRLLVRLLRDGDLRRAADARHRFSLSAVLSATDAPHRADRYPGRERSAAARRSTSASSARSAPTLRRAAAAAEGEDRPPHLDAARCALSRGAQGPRRSGDRPARAARCIRSTSRACVERAGSRRCDLHLRCRPADGVGRALSRDERQAPADRLVLARLDGQRDGAGDRRAGGLSGPAGDLAVRRRRLHHADGRSAQPERSSSCR